MEFKIIKARKRYHIPDILASFIYKNNGWKINIRLKDTVLDSLNIKIGDRLMVAYAAEDPRILFLKKAPTGNKLSYTNRILISSPFNIKESLKSINIPYEIKDDGIYLYFNQTHELE